MKKSHLLQKRGYLLFFILVLTSLGFIYPQKTINGFSINLEELQENDLQIETPKEFTDLDYEIAIENFYNQYATYVIVADLNDPNGIDPSLLPPDIASLINDNTKVIAYKETKRPDKDQATNLLLLDLICVDDAIFGIPCATSDGTRDTTVSKVFGGIEQFSRVLALRYDDYSGCDRFCVGWEFEQQWAKWTRTSSSWTIGTNSARMRTYSTAPEDFCTENSVSLNYSSSWFTPTFSGNSTSWWSISGFQNIAYVPFPSAISETQGDLYQSGVLQYNDAKTQQVFTND
ncbi:MAG: hypothetical protein GYA45_00685 [Pelolinea sp.]|jgi:hypothetical protein|nr:hypothetical protein [Pelolinea sp.]